jgi:hypothetical protein
LLILCCGCGPGQRPETAAPVSTASDQTPPVEPSEPSVLPAHEVALRLILVDRHRDKLSILARITNNLDQPIVIDRDFSVRFNWLLEADDNSDLRPARTYSGEPTDELRDKSRFVSVAPGESLSHEFVLTRPFRHFVVGEGAVFTPDGSPDFIPTGYEEECLYDIPESTRDLSISLDYGPQWFHVDGFSVWFGYAPQDVNLWDGRCSASIQVTLE